MNGKKPAILETEALTRRFGTLTAVDALTISVDAGEVFGLLGPNGAGKTTAIKMLTTLLPPTSGRARVAGFDITRQAASVRRAIGYVPQAVSVDGSLTGYENLLIFAKLYDIPRKERESRLRDALAFMGMGQVITMPLFFASNAIYPISLMPGWLQIVSHANPLTYEVDALRALMLAHGTSSFGLGLDFSILLAATAIALTVGARLYPRVVT